MNAKFEKWYRPAYSGSLIRDDHGEYRNQDTWESFEAWQAALQSLEVTPDLLSIAHGHFDHVFALDVRMSDGEVTDNREEAIKEALTAVFNAIKEQAK